MAKETGAAAVDFEFGEPEAEVRTGRGSWKDDAEKAVAPLDALIHGFHAQHGGNGDGYSRSVTRFNYPAIPEPKREDVKIGTGEGEVKAEDAEAAYQKLHAQRVSRIVQRINQRADDLGVKVHARSIRGKLHLVVGEKPKVERKRKADGETPENAEAARDNQSAATAAAE